MDSPVQTTKTHREDTEADEPINGQAERYRWRLSRNVMADVTLTGESITAKDLEMLRRYLELAKTALEDGDNANVGDNVRGPD